MASAHTLEGLVVDPSSGSYPGRVTIDDGSIVSVDRRDDASTDRLLLPGFIDLQVYAPEGIGRQGVTGYLLATREVAEQEDPLCLGLHLEGPFLNPEAAGAIPREELVPVNRALVHDWAARSDLVRLVTLSPELPGALEAVEGLVAAGIVVGMGHSFANALMVGAAVDRGARFATHVWNATKPVKARNTGPVPRLLLDDRVILGLLTDGRHLNPLVEELTVRVAGPERIALTSDLVPLPAQRPDGTLLGGNCCGAALVARMARFGLVEAATMAALVPARLLGLADRGRIAPGYRADIAVLAPDFAPLETLVGGEAL